MLEKNYCCLLYELLKFTDNFAFGGSFSRPSFALKQTMEDMNFHHGVSDDCTFLENKQKVTKIALKVSHQLSKEEHLTPLTDHKFPMKLSTKSKNQPSIITKKRPKYLRGNPCRKNHEVSNSKI